MNTKSCEYLLAIAEKKTLSTAAKSLGLSQPTLSAFLSNTEQQLKQTLFSRQQKELIPTNAGLIYLEACRKIVEVKRQTYQSMLAFSDQYSERFTVGVTPHRGSTMFSQAFTEFYRYYPNVLIDVKEGYAAHLMEALDKKEVDLTLGATTPEDIQTHGFIQHNNEELLLCVPDFHPLAAYANPSEPAATIDITRFQDTPFIMWGSETTNRKIVQRLFDQVQMIPTVVYTSNNVLLMDHMIAGGAGVGFLPQAFCQPNQNRVYYSMNPPLYVTIGICFRKEETLTKAQRFFVYLTTKQRLADTSLAPPTLNDYALEILEEFEEEE